MEKNTAIVDLDKYVELVNFKATEKTHFNNIKKYVMLVVEKIDREYSRMKENNGTYIITKVDWNSIDVSKPPEKTIIENGTLKFIYT